MGLAYGACDSPDAGHAKRISVLIDAEGRVAHVWPKVDPRSHAEEALEALRG